MPLAGLTPCENLTSDEIRYYNSLGFASTTPNLFVVAGKNASKAVG